MNRILRNSLLIGGILTATTALVLYFKKQFTLLANSCYNITGGVIHSLTASEVKMSLLFKVKNTSDLTINIENAEFSVLVNNLFVTKILKKEKQTLLSHSEKIYQLDFQFNPQDLLKAGLANITPLLTDREKLIITIKGSYDVEMGVVKINKMDFSEKISLKDLMSPSPNTTKC